MRKYICFTALLIINTISFAQKEDLVLCLDRMMHTNSEALELMKKAGKEIIPLYKTMDKDNYNSTLNTIESTLGTDASNPTIQKIHQKLREKYDKLTINSNQDYPQKPLEKLSALSQQIEEERARSYKELKIQAIKARTVLDVRLILNAAYSRFYSSIMIKLIEENGASNQLIDLEKSTRPQLDNEAGLTLRLFQAFTGNKEELDPKLKSMFAYKDTGQKINAICVEKMKEANSIKVCGNFCSL